MIVAGVDHGPEADAITVEELAGLPFIDSPHGWIRRRIVDKQLDGVGIREREVVIELGHPEAMKRAAEAGLGVALLFASAVRAELETGRLREIELLDAALSMPIQLIYRKDKLFSAIQRDLMTAIEQDLHRTLTAV